MAELTIDGRPSSTPDGATILDAARSLGVSIPTLCFGEGLPHHTSCMVCVVEDEEAGRLVPACVTPASSARSVRTNTPRALRARRRAVELLLAEHAGDCEAPCSRACPAQADIPGMMRRLRAGDGAGALEVMLRTLPLAHTLAVVCPAPCERSCRRKLVDGPLEIRALKLASAREALGGESPWTPRAAPPTGLSVAIVGAGPAGLSAAWFLARAGHQCLIVEEQPSPGGALRHAVAEGRLAREQLEADVGLIRRLGVELLMGTPVRAGSDLLKLRASHDALVLATGSPESAASLLRRAGAPDPVTGASAVDRVFVAGNALRESPSRLAVRAVADGRRIARSVELTLAGAPVAPAPRPFDSHRGPVNASHLEALVRRAASLSVPPERPLAAEASRCLECDCSAKASCSLRRVAREVGAELHRTVDDPVRIVELERGRNGMSMEPGKCILCGLCVRIAERAGDRPGLALSGRGAEVRVRVPFGEDLGDALARSAQECVESCPTGALAWDR